MTKLTKWVAITALVAVAAATWLGWREAAWRQAYYADMTGELIYHVEMSHRQLVRAQGAKDVQQKADALANAFGYLVPARRQAYVLLERVAPVKLGQAAYMPSYYVPALLQYAGDLSPDMPDQALQKRIELVGGLEKALKAGLTDGVVKPGFAFVVNITKLKQSLDNFFRPMAQRVEAPSVLRFEDEPNRLTIIARQQGSELRLELDWNHTFQLFPYAVPSQLLLIKPGAGLQVTSDAGPQVRMALGPFDPFTHVGVDTNLHEAIKGTLPEGWTAGSYTTFRVPEGLSQTLIVQLPAGASPSLMLLRPASGEKAVPVDIGR